MPATTDIRPSPIAGQWYSADPKHLAAEVDGYIAKAVPHLPRLPGKVIAVVAPHAGHRYSGPVAGYAFAALAGLRPEVVAVISPMHYPYAEPLLTTAHQAYYTPLGLLPVAQEELRQLDSLLTAELGFGLAPVYRDPEHSLEIELPFLQRSLKHPFTLLPVMLRDQSEQVARQLGTALAGLFQGREVLLVASTDLSHFYTASQANRLDEVMLRQVEAFDPHAVLQAEETGKGFACGHGALAAVLWAARGLGGDQVTLLHHATSGDVTGDNSRVVGYGAAVVTRPA